MGLSVRFDDFEYELLCGPEPVVPGEPPHFALDPELKSETMWVRDGGARHVVLERKSGAVFARDADGRRQLLTATLLPSESVLSQVSEPQRFPLIGDSARLDEAVAAGLQGARFEVEPVHGSNSGCTRRGCCDR